MYILSFFLRLPPILFFIPLYITLTTLSRLSHFTFHSYTHPILISSYSCAFIHQTFKTNPNNIIPIIHNFFFFFLRKKERKKVLSFLFFLFSSIPLFGVLHLNTFPISLFFQKFKSHFPSVFLLLSYDKYKGFVFRQIFKMNRCVDAAV